MTATRYYALDGIRGLALLNMITYHAVWDLVYLFDINLQWYQSEGTYIWQQCICWTFIFLSGFCEPLGKKKMKRGIIIFSFGFLIVVTTLIALPQNRVRFGVLTLIGSCMLLMIPAEKVLQKCRPLHGLIFSITLFLLTKNVNQGISVSPTGICCRCRITGIIILYPLTWDFPCLAFIQQIIFRFCRGFSYILPDILRIVFLHTITCSRI